MMGLGGGGGGDDESSSSRCKTITELLCWCVDGVTSYFSNVRSLHLWRQQIWRLFQLVCLLNGRVEDEVSMTLFVCVEYALSLSFILCLLLKLLSSLWCS